LNDGLGNENQQHEKNDVGGMRGVAERAVSVQDPAKRMNQIKAEYDNAAEPQPKRAMIADG
jgi:hypothetical protein